MLLFLRLLPFGLAVSAAVLLCIPSFVAFESERYDERVGFACLALAVAGLSVCSWAAVRALRAALRSFAFARRCRQSGRELKLSRHRAWMIETSAPCLALAGVFRPRVVISQGIADALSEEELSVVLSHERAHRAAGDNLKRLCLLLAPGSKLLESSWTRFAEYAADRQAVQGDPRRSLALASALVRVARLGPLAQTSPVATSFLADSSELSARVDRLLAEPTIAQSPATGVWRSFAPVLVLFPLLLQPAVLRFVHSLLERLIR
jgi:beta-lactamase regulating signal transducer with metallopeptidase domain